MRIFAVRSFATLCAAFVIAIGAIVPSRGAEPDPYHVTPLCTALPSSPGHRIVVSGGGEALQNALDRA
ncbi:MAG: hypothetical protein ACRD1V_02600, partial [Vicinamibacterales bacterium]